MLSGPVVAPDSMGAVNRGLARALAARVDIDLGLVDTRPGRARERAGAGDVVDLVAREAPPPALTIRHGWPPSFARPPQGRLVTILPWEFWSPPRSWVDALDHSVDEVWCYSRWVRDGFVESGMDPERVAVVPLGVDPARFRPGVAPLALGDAAPGFRFLFVGGLIWRKGVDLLLDAYARAFTRADDVTLVVKSYGRGGPYSSEPGRERLEELMADPTAARIAHLEGEVGDDQVPGLYAACDCLVQPYRGEGYGLPIAEAMASGLPVVVPDAGAARDFVGPGTGYLVPSRRVRPERNPAGAAAGPAEMVEVDVDALAAEMRRRVARPEAGRATGAAAAAAVRADHTWDRTAALAARRVAALTR